MGNDTPRKSQSNFKKNRTISSTTDFEKAANKNVDQKGFLIKDERLTDLIMQYCVDRSSTVAVYRDSSIFGDEGVDINNKDNQEWKPIDKNNLISHFESLCQPQHSLPDQLERKRLIAVQMQQLELQEKEKQKLTSTIDHTAFLSQISIQNQTNQKRITEIIKSQAQSESGSQLTSEGEVQREINYILNGAPKQNTQKPKNREEFVDLKNKSKLQIIGEGDLGVYGLFYQDIMAFMDCMINYRYQNNFVGEVQNILNNLPVNKETLENPDKNQQRAQIFKTFSEKFLKLVTRINTRVTLQLVNLNKKYQEQRYGLYKDLLSAQTHISHLKSDLEMQETISNECKLKSHKIQKKKMEADIEISELKKIIYGLRNQNQDLILEIEEIKKQIGQQSQQHLQKQRKSQPKIHYITQKPFQSPTPIIQPSHPRPSPSQCQESKITFN